MNTNKIAVVSRMPTRTSASSNCGYSGGEYVLTICGKSLIMGLGAPDLDLANEIAAAWNAREAERLVK